MGLAGASLRGSTQRQAALETVRFNAFLVADFWGREEMAVPTPVQLPAEVVLANQAGLLHRQVNQGDCQRHGLEKQWRRGSAVDERSPVLQTLPPPQVSSQL